MSNNLSKLLVPSSINLLVERAFRGHEFLEGPVLDDVPLIQVDDVVRGLQVAEVVRDACVEISQCVWLSPRHRADAVLGTMSRRWRGAPEI